MQTDSDKDLLTYFTDVEHLRDAFEDAVATQTLPQRSARHSRCRRRG